MASCKYTGYFIVSRSKYISLWEEVLKIVTLNLEMRFKVHGEASIFFNHFFRGRQLLWLPNCFPWWSSSQMGSALKGKNLLQGEQILCFKVDHHWEGRQKWGDEKENRVASVVNVTIHLNSYSWVQQKAFIKVSVFPIFFSSIFCIFTIITLMPSHFSFIIVSELIYCLKPGLTYN